MSEIKSVCVYSASSASVSPCYLQCAESLGRLLAQNHIRLVNGAGKAGLMRACADGVLRHGGQATGVIPRFMVEHGWGYDQLTEIITTETMHERKETMIRLADAIIALPGGVGTLEELLEAITWKQLGLHRNPIVVLNANHYYDSLLAMLQNAVDERFMRPQNLKIWQVATTPEEAVRQILSAPEWSGEAIKTARL